MYRCHSKIESEDAFWKINLLPTIKNSLIFTAKDNSEKNRSILFFLFVTKSPPRWSLHQKFLLPLRLLGIKHRLWIVNWYSRQKKKKSFYWFSFQRLWEQRQRKKDKNKDNDKCGALSYVIVFIGYELFTVWLEIHLKWTTCSKRAPALKDSSKSTKSWQTCWTATNQRWTSD